MERKWYKLDEFTDEELIDIIKDGIKHYRNPKNQSSQFRLERTAVSAELISYWIDRDSLAKDRPRIDALYQKVLKTLE